jgi:hypothetical protein
LKLNHNCVRDLLLIAEEKLEYGSFLDVNDVSIKDYLPEEVLYSADKLYEAGFINAHKATYLGSGGIPSIRITSLTWDGHKFLDNIRDDGVWKNTKNIVSKFSSVSLGVVNNVASQVLTNLINQQLK